LHVDLDRIVPEPEVKNIKIQQGGTRSQTIDMDGE